MPRQRNPKELSKREQRELRELEGLTNGQKTQIEEARLRRGSERGTTHETLAELSGDVPGGGTPTDEGERRRLQSLWREARLMQWQQHPWDMPGRT